MKKFRFILLCATIGVMTAGLTGCTKSVYDEKQALEAQQGLLQFKYAEETKLELLRQSGATALQQLIGQFSLRAITTMDSLSNLNNTERKRDITIRVFDVVTDKPVMGATVSIPTLVGTVLTATSDTNGVAYFAAEKNANVPRPASVMVSKTGYASGSSISTVQTGANINIWSQTKTPNTITGKVFIENDLTNTAAEFASKALISVYTNLNNQRYEWSTLTDSVGNYTISLPDMTTNVYMNYATLEGNSKMYINSTVPGLAATPSLATIPTTFYLGLNNTYSNGVSASSFIENASVFYSVPNSVSRYHAVTPSADSLGNKFYTSSLSFNSTTGAFSSGSMSANSPTSWNADGSSKSGVASRYIAKKALVDTAVLVDVLANADKYWKTLPVLEITYTLNPLFINGIASTTNQEYVAVATIRQKTAGAVNNVEGAVYAGAVLNNRVYTTSSTGSSSYNNSSLTSQSSYTNAFYNFGSANLNGGKKVELNLSFGTGKLKTIVR
jgi:hypothetical protein